MDCREFIARHSELVDGALAPDDRTRLREHAERCSSCARYDRVVRRGGELVRQLLPRVEASSDFQPRLKHRLYHVRDESAPRHAGVYAALAVLLVAGTGVAVVANEPQTPVVQAEPVLVGPPSAPPSLVGPATPARVPLVRYSAAPARRAGAVRTVGADVRWPVYSPADYDAEFGRASVTPVASGLRITSISASLAPYGE